ncbi:MAG: antitoxin family protein [Bryobacteraceae bacterium]|jgi:predicted DNA-binding antitoxin AbrB/MazE fold protein
MTKQVEAVYENGVFRPVEPVSLAEQQRVTVLITDPQTVSGRTYLDVPYMETIRREVEALHQVSSHEEILEMTSKDPASWSDAIVAEREERF